MTETGPETPTVTATEFVEARLLEVQAAAEAVTGWGETHSSLPIFVHIALHSPGQVIRSCTAQRDALTVGGEPVAVALAASWSTHPDYGAWGSDPAPDPEVTE